MSHVATSCVARDRARGGFQSNDYAKERRDSVGRCESVERCGSVEGRGPVGDERSSRVNGECGSSGRHDTDEKCVIVSERCGLDEGHGTVSVGGVASRGGHVSSRSEVTVHD